MALGRILDQLNPTAWVPAALLVGDIAVATAYVAQTGNAMERWIAIGDLLNGKPFGVLLGVIFALALVTILTQSLGFAAIRLLEGYWGCYPPAAWFASAGIWLQEGRRKRLTRLGQRLDHKALRAAQPLIRRSLVNDPELLAALDFQINKVAISDISSDAFARANTYLSDREWVRLAPSRLTHRIDNVDDRLARFPEADRMMPTRLGLTLRFAEDNLQGPALEGNLRGYVIRNLTTLEPLVLSEHDEHRNRLDMFAVTCLMALATIPINVVILWGEVSGATLLLLSAGSVLVAVTSYRAATATAEEYGEALTAIDQIVTSGRRR